MKKKSTSRVANVLARIINIRVWFDWERMKLFTLYVGNSLRRLFMPQHNEESSDRPVLTESFRTAQKELNLSDADLALRQKALLRLSLLMSFIALLIFLYSCYHFYNGALLAGFLSFIVMLLAWSLAFRYHFWYYQIKTRKLGCSFHEWFTKGLLGAKK